MLLGQGARIPVQAVYFILIARSLGVQGYGAFIGVTALVAILAPFGSLGSGNILIKNVSRDESTFQIYWGKTLFLTLSSGLLIIILVTQLSRLLLPPSIPFSLILSISLADLLFTRLLDVASQAFQAFQKLARTSQLLVLPNITRLILLILLLLFSQHLSPAIWGYFYLVSSIISSLIGIYLVNLELGYPIFDKQIIFSEIKEGIYFSISVSSLNIYNDIDKTMLTKLSTLEAAGIYSAAYRIVDVSVIPIRSLLYASYASYFKNGLNGIRGTLTFTSKLLPIAAAYGIVISFSLFLLAPILPYFLGKEFLDTVSALRWLSPLPLIKVFHSFAADTLTGAGFQGVRSFCQACTAVINIALILYLIPILSWKGAAYASLATDSFLAITLWIVVIYINKRTSFANKPLA